MAKKLRNYTIEDYSGENPGILGRAGILEHVGTMLDDDHILEDGETITLKISRHDMTQGQIDALPEV